MQCAWEGVGVVVGVMLCLCVCVCLFWRGDVGVRIFVRLHVEVE